MLRFFSCVKDIFSPLRITFCKSYYSSICWANVAITVLPRQRCVSSLLLVLLIERCYCSARWCVCMNLYTTDVQSPFLSMPAPLKVYRDPCRGWPYASVWPRWVMPASLKVYRDPCRGCPYASVWPRWAMPAPLKVYRDPCRGCPYVSVRPSWAMLIIRCQRARKSKTTRYCSWRLTRAV